MDTPIEPTPANFRAEKCRHRFDLESLAEVSGLQPTQISMYLNETRKLSDRGRRTLIRAFNRLAGRELFPEPAEA